jgi:hypothetical protein
LVGGDLGRQLQFSPTELRHLPSSSSCLPNLYTHGSFYFGSVGDGLTVRSMPRNQKKVFVLAFLFLDPVAYI